MMNDVVSEEGALLNADGKELFTKLWKPKEKQPSVLVFVCHGFGEHCLRYEPLGNALASEGYLVISHDHVGHGQSQGERVQISDFSHYARDVFQHIDNVAAKNSGIPIFIFGHSMGGTITISAMMERPDFFTGVVLSAPSIIPDPTAVNSCKIFLGKILAWILPSMQVTGPVDPSKLSQDPEQVKKYTTDQLIWHEGMKAKWTSEILATMENIRRNIDAPHVKTPFLLMHGSDDQVVPIEGSEMLFKQSRSTNKTYKVFPQCRHELLNELKEDADVVLSDTLDWIKKRLQ